MHYAFFTHQYPAMHSNGGAELSYSFISELRRKNHKVSLFILAVDEYYKKSVANKDKLEKICDNLHIYRCDRKISLIMSIVKNPINFFFPKNNIVLPAFDLRGEIQHVIKGLNPDRIIVYDWWSAPSIFDYDKPKAIIVGDLLHFPAYTTLFLKKYLGENTTNLIFSIRQKLATLWTLWHYIRIQKYILSKCKVAGSFGKYDAEWLKKKGVKNSKYYKTPYSDISTQKLLNFEERKKLKNKKYKIATSFGRLNATATSSGLYLLKKDLLKLYDKCLGRDNYEVHIYGDGFLKKNLLSLKEEKNVFLRGYVNDIDNELITSDIFLLATNIFLGYRCRLINGLCRGLPMVISKYDVINQPELIDGYNCFIGENSEDIVNKSKILLEDRNLRLKLMKNARQTYLNNFSTENSVNNILNEFDNNEN